MFKHIPPYPGDPIMSLFEAFQKDHHPRKINLSIGLYYDNENNIPVLECVRRAKALLANEDKPHTYLPMEGMALYRQMLQETVFGKDSPVLRDKRVATIQSVGGSGALRIGADFLKTYFPGSAVWVSDPTWDNHQVIFAGAGLEIHAYPYYDELTNSLKFEQMLGCISTLPAHSIVLLQPCCHNPTGIDMSREQWLELIPVLQQRRLIPFMDMAYQGFGDGLDEDAWAIRTMANAGMPFVVSNSFSKNFSLYGERSGGLSFVAASEAEATTILGQLKAAVRRIYSSPPLYGARLISTVLGTPELAAQWDAEVAQMRIRIRHMRTSLQQLLQHKLSEAAAGYLTEQRGMFSYTGLSAAEVDRLREEQGVYLLRSGRMCVAGLNEANIEHVAASMADILRARINP
ncbi:Biosynthetic Aromatic amino acid aminotransferase alpha [Collimonas arenae]|uniref:Biosynthetic Aromatic amino acid aminotransferase alpha n=1 Tax=Collimonas arenae TaxID=279058 RepID=A0A0A1FE73_9BURK|nr:amino acid aminotransferase [Collimonas arenae]AIY41959.1 Biosynthetic Aromatic amino acid aminotransferase alpha [Collimonas arenae]